jgi:subtilisin family serine protease
MKNIAQKLGLCLALATPFSAFAATIAIIDSGSDFKHVDFKDQYQINEKEIPANKKDDDKNGYVDDVYGYNLIEKKPDVIDYSYLEKLKPFMPDIHKFFEVQTRIIDKTASDEDKAWMKFMRGQEGFIKELEIFGNFAHGTHVTGITSGISTTKVPENHPFAVKIIPTEVNLPTSVLYMQSPSFQAIVKSTKTGIPASIRKAGLSLGLRFLAKLQMKMFGKVGVYVNNRGADVANGSFGTGYTQVRTIVEMLYNAVFKEEERNKADVDELTAGYMQQILIHARSMPLAAPNTLFVFAAGNDGSDNDVIPCSPANLREDNTITVAATLRNRELAYFSNYGATKVDVAAPGVGIKSTYPGDDHGQMSGTSQAAPYVSMVAGIIKNQNPSLRPIDIKAILMGTVDMKEWLTTKVKSGGLVNPSRAKDAALLSKEMGVFAAINASRSRIKDQDVEEKPSNPTPNTDHDLGFAIFPLVSPIN